MSNPFSGLIDGDMHDLYTNMIDSLLEDKSLTTCCEFVFGNCRFVECDNCSNGVYKPGGPYYFPNGKLCPFCTGKGKTSLEERECLWLCVEFESRGWETQIGKMRKYTQTADFGAETFCRVELWPKLMSCEYAILDKCNPCVAEKYRRIGRPELCGLGRKEYIRLFWEPA